MPRSFAATGAETMFTSGFCARMTPAMAAAEMLAAERGLMGLPGPFFGPGQGRHIRLAFANAEEAAIALVPERLAGRLGGALESGD
mgnify:CR=1 FL=1